MERSVIEENLELDAQSQRAAAEALAEKLRRKYAADSAQKRRQKMYAALTRRGFSYDDIRAVVERAEGEAEDELF